MNEIGSLAARIEETIGADLTRQLLRARGGTEIHIPARAKGSVLAGLIGDDAAHLLFLEFGTGNLTLPQGDMRGIAGRRRVAKRMLAEGATNAEVAQLCDLHLRTVSKYRAEMRDDRQLRLDLGGDHERVQGSNDAS